ncbi:IPTL-CTERM sorting domain-containing protein [Acidovorax sp. BL-A-41-H1]|uniref:IPTL-CTERM sorting domain-containing protein n=1 Tax=Acidovorax sp. BL-A-41-H1 TaxID=3421102 RepID=UPI003F7B051B
MITLVRASERTLTSFGHQPDGSWYGPGNKPWLFVDIHGVLLFYIHIRIAPVKTFMRNLAGLHALWCATFAWALLALASPVSAGSHPLPVVQPAGILFIVSDVGDHQQLAAAAGPSLEVVVLDAKGDGLDQMADALAGRTHVPAVHLISHGSSGALNLGSVTLNRSTLAQRGAALARIRAALANDADLLLYGCEAGLGQEGQEFVAMLASATGARVAASTNLTGARELGGDWVLERTTGVLRSAALDFPDYGAVLATVAGTVAIPFGLPDGSFFTPKMVDGQASTGTADISGVVYEFYFADFGNVQTGQVTNYDLTGGTGSMLLYSSNGIGQYDPVGALIIKTQLNRLFGLSSFRIQDAQGLSSTYIATGYRNNATVGAAWTFTTGGNLNPVLITLPAQFKDVDEVRITSNGGIGGVGPKLWQEGFNYFVFIDPTTNADLAGLSASAAALSPAFTSGTTSYGATVAFATTSTTITPTADIPGSTITVNGVTVASGAASGAIALSPGANTITTIVTSSGGTTKTYTLTVNRVPSTNANLSALSLSSGTLAPAFAAATTSYTASVSNATTSMTVTPTVADSTATVTVNGVAVTSGSASGAIALAVGANTITTVVSAQDGTTTMSYTITVTRAASANANLSALSLSSGTLSPVFNAATTGYTASVGNATTALTVTPSVADANASVTVNGVVVSGGNASGAIALNVGSNTITTVVTAQNGATKTYTVTVTRAASSNADLSALSLSSGTLAPAFAAATLGYTATVGNATTSLTVTPTLASGAASVTVNGVATTSGSASGAIALAVGNNIITIVVTAQDGVTTNTYTVTVTRALSSNADLSALSLSGGTLTPAFASATTSYTANVGNATTSLTITPTVASGSSSVTVNGVATTSGNASGAIALNVGGNTITTVVTAQDGVTTKTYTVTVTRAASTNADLSALSLSNGTLAPAFAAATTGYTASVGSATTALTVTPTVASGSSSVTINGVVTASGSASGPIALNAGSNTITTVVTAQDGITTKTYTVTVTRAYPITATGTSPAGGGNVNASLAGPAGCGFGRAAFIPRTGGANSPPVGGAAGYVFSQGLFDVVVDGCPGAAAVTITLTYPQAFPAGAVYMKYGPTPTQNAPHWYPFPAATIAGNTVTLPLTDGAVGDDDLAANGSIADPGGVGLAVAASGGASIPTLSQWGMLLLSLLLAACGLYAARHQRLGRST